MFIEAIIEALDAIWEIPARMPGIRRDGLAAPVHVVLRAPTVLLLGAS